MASICNPHNESVRLAAILGSRCQRNYSTGHNERKWLRCSLTEGLAEHKADTHRNGLCPAARLTHTVRHVLRYVFDRCSWKP